MNGASQGSAILLDTKQTVSRIGSTVVAKRETERDPETIT